MHNKVTLQLPQITKKNYPPQAFRCPCLGPENKSSRLHGSLHEALIWLWYWSDRSRPSKPWTHTKITRWSYIQIGMTPHYFKRSVKRWRMRSIMSAIFHVFPLDSLIFHFENVAFEVMVVVVVLTHAEFWCWEKIVHSWNRMCIPQRRPLTAWVWSVTLWLGRLGPSIKCTRPSPFFAQNSMIGFTFVLRSMFRMDSHSNLICSQQ